MNHLHHHRIRSGILAGTVVMAMGLLTGATAAHAVPFVLTPDGPGGVTQTDTIVTGTSGDDTIDCGGASPGKTINGSDGNDTVTGTAEADTINGDDGNDTITGGASDDTLNGGLGIDTISGSAGDDNLVGPSNDGRRDSLDGGLNTDTCQGPPPDPDGHASCENATSPPAGSFLAEPLCQASGGVFANVTPLLYTCVFLPFTDHRVAEARSICTQRGGVFADLPLSYSCVLPSGTLARAFPLV